MMPGLHLLPTMHSVATAAVPTLNMVKSQRLYCCSEKEIPHSVSPATMRDIFLLVNDARAFIGEGNLVFVTKKRIVVPAGLKRVPVDQLLISFEVPEVKIGFCDFLLNEVFPCVSKEEVEKWHLDFLVDLDRILSIPMENEFGETGYNFRTLRNRVCTKYMTGPECEKVLKAVPEISTLIRIFQDSVQDSVQDSEPAYHNIV